MTMSAIRKIGKSLGSSFFVFFLTATILILSMIQLTNPENMKLIFTDILNQQLKENSDYSKIYSQVYQYCSLDPTKPIELSSMDQNITLNCSDVQSKKSEEEFKNFLIGKVFDQIYYKKYDCSYIECLNRPVQNKILVLVSAKTNEFLKSILIYSIIATAVFAIIFAASCEKISGVFKGLGTSLIVIGLPYFIIEFLLIKLLPSELISKVSNIIDQVLSSFSKKFLIVLAVGIILTIIGLIIEYVGKKKKSSYIA